MQEDEFDFARRAAEKFMAANRTEDPREAARLRRQAYELVERMREQEERGGRSRLGWDSKELAWGEVLAERGKLGRSRPPAG